MEANSKRSLMVSSRWGQAIVIVFLFGFFVMGLLAYRTYTGEPPVPAKVAGPSGQVLFTSADITRGQETFLRNGLMEYGSIFGHGAYLGPDFTADYLHRAALSVLSQYGGPDSDRARAETMADFKTNRYNARTGTLEYTAAEATAFRELEDHYREFFSQPSTRFGLRPKAITDPQQLRDITAFFSWSAWASAAQRPGLEYSYTNNWPSEPLVNNHLTADAVVWSVLSLALLLLAGLILAVQAAWYNQTRDRVVIAILLIAVGALALRLFRQVDIAPDPAQDTFHNRQSYL